MNLNEAIEALKAGSKVTRPIIAEKGGAYLELISEDSEHAHTEAAKQFWQGRSLPVGSALEGIELPEGSHIAVKIPSHDVVAPWWGTAEDSAAEDWTIVEEK